MSKSSPEEISRIFKQHIPQSGTIRDTQNIDSDLNRFNQVTTGVVLAGILHPNGYCTEETDLEQLAEDTDLFFQIVIVQVMNHNGFPIRHSGSTLLCMFGGTFLRTKDSSDIHTALLAMENINTELGKVNRQLSSQSKKLLNTGFGLTFGALLGGIRGPKNFSGYGLVSGVVYLAESLALLAQHGEWFANAELVEKISSQTGSYSTKEINLTNGTSYTVHKIA